MERNAPVMAVGGYSPPWCGKDALLSGAEQSNLEDGAWFSAEQTRTPLLRVPQRET